MRGLSPVRHCHSVHRDASPPRILAVEIGGTTTRIATSRSSANAPDPGFLARIATPNYLTHSGIGASEILDLLAISIAKVAAEAGARDPDVVVIAWPGPVIDGVALRSPTILGPHLDCRHDVRAHLRAHFPRARIHVLNDLTCAGYHYVARGFLDFCIVTVGSGIGNKVFLGGAPQVGAQGFGGEIGHLLMMPAPSSPHRQPEELGSMASGRGTLWLAQGWDAAPDAQSPRRPIAAGESEALVSAFRAGDAHARRVVETGAYPLCVALGALHLGIGLMRFIIVGGFAKALGEEYRALLARQCRDLTWDIGQDWDRMILLGEDDCDEGLSGAQYFALQEVGVALPC